MYILTLLSKKSSQYVKAFNITGTVFEIKTKGTKWAMYFAVLFATKKSSKLDLV
jgi:hypothetical protein